MSRKRNGEKQNNKHILVCIDGLIGVGKSTLCNRLPENNFRSSDFKFSRFLETAHSYSLPTLEKFISTELDNEHNVHSIDHISRKMYDESKSAIKCLEISISDLKGVQKTSSSSSSAPLHSIIHRMEKEIITLKKGIDFFEKRWENEIFGIFQNVMISSSYSTILNKFPTDDLDVNNKNIGSSSSSSSSSISSSSSYDDIDDINDSYYDDIDVLSTSSPTEVMLLDRDPISNRIFFEILDSQNLLSPTSKFFYENVYQDYSKRFMSKSFEIWLWCEPKTALSRIYSRGREEEKRNHTEDTLWSYQNIKLRDLILSYCDGSRIFIKGSDGNYISQSSYSLDKRRPCFVIPWCEINHENDDSIVDPNVFGDDNYILEKVKLWKNLCNKCIFNKYLPKISLYIDSNQKSSKSIKLSSSSSSPSIFDFDNKKMSMKNFGNINYAQYKIPHDNNKNVCCSSSSSCKFSTSNKSTTVKKRVIVIKSESISQIVENRDLNNRLFKIMCQSSLNDDKLSINIFLKVNPFISR